MILSGVQRFPDVVETVSMSAKVMAAYVFIFLVGSLYGNFASSGLNQIILWVLGPMVLFYVLSNNITKITKLPVEIKLFGALLPISLLGLVNVEDTDGYFRYIKVILSNWLLMIMVFSSVEKPNEIKLLFKSVFLASITVAVLSVVIKDPTQDASDEYYRLTGITGNANGLATFSRIGVLLALFYAFTAEGVVKKLMYVGLLGFCINVIILTASRGAFANIFLSLAMFFFFKRLSGGRLVAALIVVYILYMIFLTFGDALFGDTFLYRRLTRNDSLDDAVEGEARLSLYQKTFSLFLDNPIIGVGLNQIKYKLGSISHSDLLDIAAQTGILGLIAYLSIYIQMFKRIIKNWGVNNKLFSSYSSTFFMTLFVSELIYGISNPNWFSQINMFILAIIVSHYCIVDKQVSQNRIKSLANRAPAFMPGR
jgi:O-antigen ligase